MRARSARLELSVAWALALALAPLLGGCVDTTLPDLSQQLGNGRTDGPLCTIDEIEGLAPETLKITLIDVGQGDAVWIQTPWVNNEEVESLDILIDAGPSGTIPGTSPGGEVVVDYLLSHGLAPGESIDTVIVTHAHEDHYGGLGAVAETFEILNYVDPGFTAGSSAFLAARQAALSDVQRLGGVAATPAVPELAPAWFQRVDLFGPIVDEARLIWSSATPPSGKVDDPSGTDVNNTSVAFAIRYGGQQILLMGDLEQEVEQQLVTAANQGQLNLAASVLKVGHHGSDTASTQAFLDRVFPTKGADNAWAVISSGRRSFSGAQLPTEAALARLQARLARYHLLSTENRDEDKAAGTEHGDDHIIVTIDANGVTRACYAP